MTYISVTNALNDNSATSDITKVGTNFTDIINGLSDGTKDINISQITVGGGNAVSKLDFGTYTPTITNSTNVGSSTPRLCYYLRVGTLVVVCGVADIALTAADTQSIWSLSLPIASNFSSAYDCDGLASRGGGAAGSANVNGDTGNDVAKFIGSATALGSEVWGFTFSYTII